MNEYFESHTTQPSELNLANKHFNAAFTDLILVEGGYSNDPADPGGKTMYGITERVARAAGYHGSMTELTLANAKHIYRHRYWHPLALDSVCQSAPLLAAELFECGVNCGTGRAAEYLQRSLNVLNRQERDYSDLTVDGDVGPATLKAFHRYIERRGRQGERALTAACNALQGVHYITLAERNSKFERFVFGWLDKRVA